MRTHLSLSQPAYLMRAMRNVLILAALGCCAFAQNPVPDPSAVVLHGKLRVTVLSDSLVRIEASNYTNAANPNDIKFDDRATLAMVNRDTPVPAYSVKKINATAISISLPAMEIVHNAVYPSIVAKCDSSGWSTNTD